MTLHDSVQDQNIYSFYFRT